MTPIEAVVKTDEQGRKYALVFTDAGEVVVYESHLHPGAIVVDVITTEDDQTDRFRVAVNDGYVFDPVGGQS